MTKYLVQILLDRGKKTERWEYVHPTGGQPYEYETREEAEKASRLSYDTNPTIVRVVSDEDMFSDEHRYKGRPRKE